MPPEVTKLFLADGEFDWTGAEEQQIDFISQSGKKDVRSCFVKDVVPKTHQRKLSVAGNAADILDADQKRFEEEQLESPVQTFYCIHDTERGQPFVFLGPVFPSSCPLPSTFFPPLFIHSFIHIYLFIYLLHPFTNPYIHSFTHPLLCFIIHQFINALSIS